MAFPQGNGQCPRNANRFGIEPVYPTFYAAGWAAPGQGRDPGHRTPCSTCNCQGREGARF